MSSQKLVRCEVDRGDGRPASPRFVPIEIFGLWEYLMVHRHEFRVAGRNASVWVELEEGGSQVKSPVEHVTEIALFVFEPKDGMLTRVCRYVPSDEASRVREILLAHYKPPAGSTAPAPWVRERAGVWFRPRPEGETMARAGTTGATR